MTKHERYNKSEKGRARSARWFHTSSYRAKRKTWKASNPEKVKAQVLVLRKIRQGILHRAPVCMSCGQWSFTEAHHADYGKPLAIIWLCRKCHRNLRERNMDRLSES